MKLNPLVLMRREIDDTGLIFEPENNKAMPLNKVGVMIWKFIEKGLSEEQIVREVTSKFEVDRTAAARDVSAFLNSLRDKGLPAD